MDSGDKITFIYKLPHGYFNGGVFQIRSYRELFRVEWKQPVNMRRQEAIRYKLMPDGHIRAFQSDTPDLRGVSELNVHLLKAVSPTLTVNHVPKILIANERLQAVLHDALLR